ncbi:MAG: DEAD/DEAH box helicase [Armatimonadetes bacterium]|nr:DEAD/DEAH box helicase [Armatimonadota bacterium]
MAEIWERVEQNCQETAEQQDLVEPGETFTLTRDQSLAIDAMNGFLRENRARMLLVAPTGAGKTEVEMRVGLGSYLATMRTTIILVPTRDLSRQHFQYLSDRLQGTGLRVCELHGGVPPGQRRRDIDAAVQGHVAFAVGSAMVLHSRNYRGMLDEAGLIIVDDANAFDERQDLSHLRGVRAPCLFASATPSAVGGFLKSEGAWNTRFEMKTMPFDSPATEIHKVEAAFGENVFSQLDRAEHLVKQHLENRSRIYVISRTRAKVPTMKLYLEDRYKISVSMLHGEMADTKEHSTRQRGTKSVWATGPETRTEMMRNFKYNLPSMMVATNLVGSGLDIPMADLIVITDADHFSESEIEQLVGRVGRRQHRSDAALISGTVVNREASSMRGKTTVKNGRVVMTFGSSRGRRRR